MSSFARTVIAGAAFVVCSAGAAAAYPATVSQDLHLRSGPSTGYAVVATMPAGAQVDVGNCLSNGWCQLSFTGVEGYASSNYLSGSPQSTVVVEPDTVFPQYYSYWDTYPPYWDNGFFYYYNGRGYARTRRDRAWWNGHRRSFSHYQVRRGVPPHFNRGNRGFRQPAARAPHAVQHQGRPARGNRGFNAAPQHRSAPHQARPANRGFNAAPQHRAAPHQARPANRGVRAAPQRRAAPHQARPANRGFGAAAPRRGGGGNNRKNQGFR